MNDNNQSRPRVFIEESFPSDLLNEQVQQETGPNPFKSVHRWFARKPLSFSRASILATLLPADTSPETFKQLMGFPGQSSPNFRLYQHTPPAFAIAEVQKRCCFIWGDDIRLLDAFAGGGSIPFEAARYGFTTLAFDLNAVAVATMKAGIEVPFTLGWDFVQDLRYWIDHIGSEAQTRLSKYFLAPEGERTRDYLWAHTATCPECALSVPLAPSWWVDNSPAARKAGRACSVRIIVPTREQGNICDFEMVRGIVKDNKIQDYNPNDTGTLARATGRCPRCQTILSTDYLMNQGRSGKFGYQLYAVIYHNGRGELLCRIPSQQDIDGAAQAERALVEAMPHLLQADLIPVEDIPHDTQRGPDLNLYGLFSWRDFYTPRQLLSLTTLLDLVQQAIKTYSQSATEEKVKALALWLTMILDRCVDKNARLARWDNTVKAVQSVSSTHALNLMWNFPEPNGATRLWQQCAETVAGDYQQLCVLAQQAPHQGFLPEHTVKIDVNLGDAANLAGIEDGYITAIVTDPPYYSAIRYAEIADMYYVWQKRVLQEILPDLYLDELSNKELETIANPGRFRGLPNAADLADRDYEAKLTRAFVEYHRVLRDDGVLTVQFNHKESGAWDILSQTLISAGFEITATWAVNTENPASIHQALKNAVSSTVLLVCRKRIDSTPAWWEDIQPKVRQAVMSRVPALEAMGMKGIDLYLAAFGPALQVLSKNWPVLDRTNTEVRPEAALQEARNAVVDQRMDQMTEGRYVQLDPVSRFYLIAWDCFLAREFSFDEARLLTLSTGDVSIAELRDRYHIVAKKGNDVAFLTPRERVRLGEVKVQAPTYDRMVDALHAALALYLDEGITAVQRFFARTNLFNNPDFTQFVELALKMMPAASDEHKALSDLLMSDVKLRSYVQMPLFGGIEAETHEQPRLF